MPSHVFSFAVSSGAFHTSGFKGERPQQEGKPKLVHPFCLKPMSTIATEMSQICTYVHM